MFPVYRDEKVNRATRIFYGSKQSKNELWRAPEGRGLAGLSRPRFLASSQGRVVLKIAITDLPDEQRWSLQGQLVGQWAAELKSTWREAHHAGDKRRRIIELIEVISIDRDGEAVLAEIMSEGAECIASDVYTKHLIRKLRSELKRRRMKGTQDEGGNH
jgi:hypothetical protein